MPEFCIFDHIDTRGGAVSALYADRLAFAQFAERAGFDGYYIAEHHSTPLGHAASPSVFLGALSQRTERMRIGSMVHVLPAYQPLRLAEEICMLDHLSGGRLDIGVGRGASPYEVSLFGVGPQQARPMFEEALSVLQKALTSDTIDLRGEFYRYYDVPMMLRPLQAGGPPLWYGAFSERNLAFAAAHGLNITLNGPPVRLRQLSQRYRELWQDQSRAGVPKVASMYQVVIAQSDAEAERIAEPAYARWFASMTHLWRANNAMPRESLPSDCASAIRLGSLVAGSAATVRDKLKAIIDLSGIDRLLLQCYFGTMEQESALETVSRFAAEVRPQLGTDESEGRLLARGVA